jgi:hypothetical protein
MNYFNELIKIADKVTDEKDKQILYEAAVKLVPGPEKKMDETKYIPGYGYQRTIVYKGA